MARVTLVLRAFDAEELQLLSQWAENEEKRSKEEGYIPPEIFHELKETIQLAKQYASAMRRERLV